MINRTSALDNHFKKSEQLIEGKANLTFARKIDLQIIQIAAWPDTVSKVESIISKHLNIPSLPKANNAFENKSVVVMKIEPLKWWILGSDIPLFSTEEGTTLDLSHSFTNIEISGPKSKVFLNRFLPLDLRDNSFKVNNMASTAIHHVSVKLWHSQNSFHLFIPRGFALSLWKTFMESAKQFGYEIK